MGMQPFIAGDILPLERMWSVAKVTAGMGSDTMLSL